MTDITTRATDILARAIESVQDGADTILACHTVAGEWEEDDVADAAKVIYDREIALVADLSALKAAFVRGELYTAAQMQAYGADMVAAIRAERVGVPTMAEANAAIAAEFPDDPVGAVRAHAAFTKLLAAAPAPVSAPPSAESPAVARALTDDVKHIQELMLKWINQPPGHLAKAAWNEIEREMSALLAHAAQAQGVTDEAPEGCTPADARMLREANHALAAENDRLRMLLRPFAQIAVGKLSWALVEYHVGGDPEKQVFRVPQMQRAFNRAADALRENFPCDVSQSQKDDARDAERYRWLRQQHWNDADMFVVTGGKESVRLGTDCPALDRLDETIDAEIERIDRAKGGSDADR